MLYVYLSYTDLKFLGALAGKLHHTLFLPFPFIFFLFFLRHKSQDIFLVNTALGQIRSSNQMEFYLPISIRQSLLVK